MVPIDTSDNKSNDLSNKGHLSSAELLKSLGEITPKDIDKLLTLARDSGNNKPAHDDTINKYLSIVNQVFGGNSYLSIGDTVETRRQRYEIYDEMDESTSYISAALDILSDDATQKDEDGFIMRVICENSKVKSIVEDMFDRLDIEGHLGKWARTIAKYGDFFLKINLDGKEITSINDTIYPSNIERRDLEGKLVAFCDSYTNLASNNIYSPWEFIHFRLKGDIYRSQRDNSRLGLGNTDDRYYSLTSSYGQSILRPAIKVYAQLRFVENLIILARLTNSIKRNIFLINTGDTDPTKAFETIRNYADLLKKDISLDIEKGVYNSQKHTFTYDEDIFIPVNDTKNDVRIETVGGDANIKEQYDLEYLLNKLFSALKIPKAYLNYEQDLNARSTLIQLDIRYARTVSQIQTSLIGGLMRLAKIQLAHKGIDPDAVDIDIELTSVSSIDKEARLEQKKVSLDSAKQLWDMVIEMNDKLAELKGANQQSPMSGMFGEDTEPNQEPQQGFDTQGEQPQAPAPMKPTPAPQEPDQADASPLDLEFFAEKVFTEYFDFDEDTVAKLFRKPKKKNDENKSLKSVRISESRHYPNSDVREMYPTEINIHNFIPIKESLLNNGREKKTSDAEDFSVGG